MSPSVEDKEALEALRAVRASQEEMVRRVTGQNWYHWVLGLIAAGMTAAQLLPPVFRAPAVGVAVVCIALLVQVYKRRTGVWVGGLRPGLTAWIAVLMGLVVGAGQAASLWAGRQGTPELGLAAVAVVFAAVTGLGHAWDAAYRADMENRR